MDAPQPALLVVDARRAARFVIGDDQLALGAELEAVDDAPQAQVADLGLELELEADGVDGGRVLELEVVAQETLGVGGEVGLLLGGELEPGVLGVGAELGPGLVEAGESGDQRALAGLAAEQELEGAVHERALGGRRRRGLGQVVDGREAEGEGAVLERRHLGGAERGGQG